MAKHHGSRSYFSIDSDDLTAYIDNIEFPETVDVAETSTMGQESKTYIAGLSDSTISIAGKWDETATTGPDAVLSSLLASKVASVFAFGPGGDATGAIRYTGDAILTSYSKTSPLGDVVAFAAEFQVTGDVTHDTFPV